MDPLELFPVGQMMIRNEFINRPKIYSFCHQIDFQFLYFDKIGNSDKENVGLEEFENI